MNHRELSAGQQLFLTVLEAFGEPVKLNVVASLVPISSLELLDLVTDLSQTGWLERVNDTLRLTPELPLPVKEALRRNMTPTRVLELLDRIRTAGLQDQLSSVVMIRLMEEAGQSKAAGHFAYDNALAEIEKGSLDRAFKSYVSAVSLLAPFLGDGECDRRYVLAAFSLSDLVVHVRRDHEMVLKVVAQARKVCRRLGDRRSLALTYLHKGRVSQMINLLDDAVGSFVKGLNMIENLGDKDIRAQSEEFHGLYYYILGHAKQAADHYERAPSVKTLREGHLPNPLIPLFLGNSLALMGQFYRAIGLLDASWRRSEMRGDASTARFYRADLGNILLMAGKRSEALHHLTEAEEQCIAEGDAWSLFWAQRALAYYFYLEGHPRKSYEKLRGSLESLVTSGFHRPFYGLPWILEMLFEYHKRKYEPLPEWDFETEMAAVVKGKNILLRGTAFRIQAEMGVSAGKTSTTTETLLLKSEADLKEAEALVELAKTKAELAKLKLREGHDVEALELALESWEGLSVCGHVSFPKELNSLIHGLESVTTSRVPTDEILNRYMEMMDDMLPTEDPEEFFSRVVAASCRFFRAERGGIFSMEDIDRPQSLVLRAGYNLNYNDVRSEVFQMSLTRIVEAYRTNRIIMKKPSRSEVDGTGRHAYESLCLPIATEGRTVGVLFHENAYSQGSFDFLDSEMLSRLAQGIGNYVIRLRQYLEQMERNSIRVIRETSVSDHSYAMQILTQSPVMRELLTRADRVSKTDVPTLLLGETGVGKELMARRLHETSPRATRPFIAVNLSSVPETLVESELFGHEKGAFTGADRQRRGRMELANSGTLFIDEVGDLPRTVQVKLLRALEDKAFFRVGGASNIKSDFRLIAATNRDLVKEVESGRFREDLYYRLNVVPLILPPLRERGEDVLYLAEYFLKFYARKFRRALPVLTAEDKGRLTDYRWPGNVRELKNVIERSMVLSDDANLELLIPDYPIRPPNAGDSLPNSFSDMPSMEEMQRRYIRHVLEKTAGKIGGSGGASEILGMKRTTLYTRMKRLGVS